MVPVPVVDLLSKEYAVERHKLAAQDHVRPQGRFAKYILLLPKLRSLASKTCPFRL